MGVCVCVNVCVCVWVSGKRLIHSQLFIQNQKWLRQCAKKKLKTTNWMQTIQMNIWAGHSWTRKKRRGENVIAEKPKIKQNASIHWSNYEHSVLINKIIWFGVLFFFAARRSHHFKFSNVLVLFILSFICAMWCRPHLFIYFKLATSILLGYWSSDQKNK